MSTDHLTLWLWSECLFLHGTGGIVGDGPSSFLNLIPTGKWEPGASLWFYLALLGTRNTGKGTWKSVTAIVKQPHGWWSWVLCTDFFFVCLKQLVFYNWWGCLPADQGAGTTQQWADKVWKGRFEPPGISCILSSGLQQIKSNHKPKFTHLSEGEMMSGWNTMQAGFWRKS